MLGAIAGDMIGSIYEFNNIRTKEFELFTAKCVFTDDTVMTAAIAKALLLADLDDEESVRNTCAAQMRKFGAAYPTAGYGWGFNNWLKSRTPAPYNSWGNGSAMRVSAAAWVANDMDTVLRIAKNTSEVTHNHPEGIKGAQATAACILLARQGKSKDEIRKFVVEQYYPLAFTLDTIREDFHFNEKCHETVPQAIVAFLESTSYEDCVRGAISIGGDSDTIAAIAGSIAEAAYGIPEEIVVQVKSRLTPDLLEVVTEFKAKYK